MNKETYESLKVVIKEARVFLNEKYGHRKRLTQDEVWEQATLLRDIVRVENWVNEVAREYE